MADHPFTTDGYVHGHDLTWVKCIECGVGYAEHDSEPCGVVRIGRVGRGELAAIIRRAPGDFNEYLIADLIIDSGINGIAYSSDTDTISGIAYPLEEDMTPERPGRPAIGPMVNVRLPEDLTAWLDEQAAYYGISRAEVIRLLLSVAREDGGNYGRGVIERILGKDD